METTTELLKSYTDIDNLEVAAQFLCAFMKSTRKHLNPHSKYHTSSWYSTLLTANPELHSLLVTAHEEEDLGVIKEHSKHFPSF